MTVAEVASILKLNQQTVRETGSTRGSSLRCTSAGDVRIRRANFDALIEASVIGDPPPLCQASGTGRSRRQKAEATR